jgi:hypothetical protein
MAEPDDTSSTIDSIWLRDALTMAAGALKSEVLAKGLLTAWLGSGELPWSCLVWKAPSAESIATMRQVVDAGMLSIRYIPLAAYQEGEPEFWRALLAIDWENNLAYESGVFGATALGIKVSREHLLALLPQEPHEGEQVHGAGVWIVAEVKRMKDANEIPPGIRISELARSLERKMQKTAASDKSIRRIKAKSIENMLRTYGLWPISSIK